MANIAIRVNSRTSKSSNEQDATVKVTANGLLIDDFGDVGDRPPDPTDTCLTEGEELIAAEHYSSKINEKSVGIFGSDYHSDTTMSSPSSGAADKAESAQIPTLEDPTHNENVLKEPMQPPAKGAKAAGATSKKNPLKRGKSTDSVSSSTGSKRAKTARLQPNTAGKPARSGPNFQSGPSPAFNAGSVSGDESFM